MASLCLIAHQYSNDWEPFRSVIDATTLADTWDQCADRLLLIARSIGGPAEDAVQEAFVALATQDQQPKDPMAWLVRVTRNKLIEWQRSQRRRRQRESYACQINWFDAEVLQIDQQIDARRVTAALAAMTSPQREVIVMHLWGGMTFDTIGSVLDLSRSSAHRAFQQGITTLRHQFEFESQQPSMRTCHD